MTVSRPRSVLIVVAGVVLLLVGVGLGWWAWGGGAAERDSRAATFGTALAVVGLLITLAGWFFPGQGRGTANGTSQRASRGSVQAGRNISGAVATGRNSEATGRPSPSSNRNADRTHPQGHIDQKAGSGAVQAAGDITGAVATGKNTRAEGSSQTPDQRPEPPEGDAQGSS